MTDRRLRRVGRALVGILLAVAALLWALLPPRTRAVPAEPLVPVGTIVRGAYHIHSVRSDGSGTVDEIAAAAAADGLDFVILTDHGDGTRPPDPPEYRHGVLCLDGVEISTTGGHYVGLGMPVAPYPLGGAPEAVVEDVARLGGFGIAAHPDSAKPELAWTAWDAPVGGLEWLNADSQWRALSLAGTTRLLLTYWLRPVEALATTMTRPDVTLARWDALTSRRVPALAGADAHARLGLGEEPNREPAVARMPGYRTAFAVFHNNVLLDAPFGGNAVADAASLLVAIRAGRVFTTIDGLARGGAIDLAARSGAVSARMGGYLEPQGPVRLDGRLAAPAGATTVVLRDGTPVYETRTAAFGVELGETPGAYRVEVRLPDLPDVPWLLTNPIYVGLEPRHRAVAAAPVTGGDEGDALVMRPGAVEAADGSTSTVQPDGANPRTVVWRFDMGGGARGGQYAAARLDVHGVDGSEAIRFRVRAERPMRAWVQLRVPARPEGERWGRTFYADATSREVTLRFEDFAPIGATASPHVPLRDVDSILFVVDTVNTAPDAVNVVTLENITLVRP